MKNKTLKRLLSMVLVTVMSAALLSGCGNTAKESEESKASESSQVQESQTAPSSEAASSSSEAEADAFEHDPVLNELGAEPICKEKVTISIGIQSNANIEDYEDNYYTKMLEEAAGVDLEMILFPSGKDGKEKLNMMVAGDETLPDILLISQTDAQAMIWGEEGYIVPLEDYFEHSSYYAAEGYARVKANNGLDIVEYMRTTDGHVWSFPTYYESGTNPGYGRFFLYYPWMEKLNLETPTTTEELYEVLKAFKTQDPNGNGKADEIPVIGSKMDAKGIGSFAWEYMMNAFQHSTSTKNFLCSNDRVLSVSYTTDGWKEGIKYITKLVQEGLYDPISFTQDAETFKTIMNGSGDQIVGGFCYLSNSFIASDHPSKDQWMMCPPLIGPDGYQSVPYSADLPSNKGYITADCEHPEVAFRVMDLMCRADMTLTARWGKQGENWDYVTNLNEEEIEAKESERLGVEVEYDWATTTFAGHPALFYTIKDIWNQPNKIHWMNTQIAFRTAEVACGSSAAKIRVDETYTSNPTTAYGNAQYMEVAEQIRPQEVITKIKYPTLDEQVEAEEIQAELNKYVFEKMAGWFTGLSDVEADWDSYLKELESIGLSRFLELAQKGWK